MNHTNYHPVQPPGKAAESVWPGVTSKKSIVDCQLIDLASCGVAYCDVVPVWYGAVCWVVLCCAVLWSIAIVVHCVETQLMTEVVRVIINTNKYDESTCARLQYSISL